MVIKNLPLLMHLIKSAQASLGEDKTPPPLDDDKPSTKPSGSVGAQYTSAPKVKKIDKPVPKNNVAKMQQAILNFAKALQTTDVMSFDASKAPQGKGRGQFLPGVSTTGFGGKPYELTELGDDSQLTKPQEEELGGFEPFGNFLVSQYIKPSSQGGHQYLDVGMEQPGREESGFGAAQVKNLRGLIDSLKRIGTPESDEVSSKKDEPQYIMRMVDKKTNKYRYYLTDKSGKIIKETNKSLISSLSPSGEFYDHLGRLVNESGRLITTKGTVSGTDTEEQVDGIWDVRTQNALRNISSIVSAMLDFSQDLGKNIPGYTKADLAQFNKPLQGGPEAISAENKERWAVILTQHINAMQKFFEGFKSQIVEHKQYKPFISQESSFGKIKTEKEKAKATPAESALDNRQKIYYNDYKDQSPNPKYFGADTTYNDQHMTFGYSHLSSVDDFKKRVTEYLGREPSTDELKQIISGIRTQLSGKQV